MGENGAGKSTLIKILAGLHRADQGEILLDGVKIAPASPRDALGVGISTVFQEHSLLPTLKIAERKFIKIAPGIKGNAKVLILDEPPAALTALGAALNRNIRRLRDRGVAILCISHWIDELFALRDPAEGWPEDCHHATADITPDALTLHRGPDPAGGSGPAPFGPQSDWRPRAAGGAPWRSTAG